MNTKLNTDTENLAKPLLANRLFNFRIWNGTSMTTQRELYNDNYRIQQLNWEQNFSMQFTGLKDIEGKDIYEGDIILGYKNPHIVTFADCAFYLTYKNSSVRLSRTCGALKIIGNIFENPELLQTTP